MFDDDVGVELKFFFSRDEYTDSTSWPSLDSDTILGCFAAVVV